MEPNHTISSIQALNGKDLSMLTSTEKDVFDYFRARGRKYGVSILIIGDLPQHILDEAATSSQHDEQIAKKSNCISVHVDNTQTLQEPSLESSLGELLYFISEVAISARMNTAYNRSSAHNPDTPKAAMWLVDMLHNFHGIGDCLKKGDHALAVKQVQTLIEIWTHNKVDIERSRDLHDTGSGWSVDQGIGILQKIQVSLLAKQ